MVMDALEGKTEGPARTLLNLVLPQVIPFNRPLGLKIQRLTRDESEVTIPFKRANKNHLGGMHACAMATVGEYAAGILILKRGDPSKIRIILKNLSVDYLKQGRGDSVAKVQWPEEAPQGSLAELDDVVDIQMKTVLSDASGTELAYIHTHWQVKPWSKVRAR